MDNEAIIISSEQDSVSLVKGILEPVGFKVTAKQKVAPALKAMKGGELVVLDVPDTARSLKELHAYLPEAMVVVFSDRSCQGKAIEQDAYFCLEKPVKEEHLRSVARNAVRQMSLLAELDRLKQQSALEGDDIPGIVTTTKVKRLIERASSKDVPVLISGEHGTGREFVARTIHMRSPRRHSPFKSFSCSGEAMDSKTLMKTVTSFDGGTLYVKDFETIENELQARLSDCLDGSHGMRMICGANGRFSDTPLMDRFAIVVRLPSLKSRPADVVPLAEKFVSEAASCFALGEVKLSAQSRKELVRYDWPGNARELKNTVTRACLLAGGGVLEPGHFFPSGQAPTMSVKDFLEAKLGKYMANPGKLENASLHETVVSEVERSLIELVMGATGGNQLRTAQALGITRTTLRNKIKNYKIANGRKKKSSK
jgi:DNA-binding NtrC family response regulator